MKKCKHCNKDELDYDNDRCKIEDCPKCNDDIADCLSWDFKGRFVKCCKCQSTGIQPQEFENEKCDNCEGLGILERIQGSERKCIDCKGTGFKHKSGDIISICPKCKLENYGDMNCGVKPEKFKVLSTKDNKLIIVPIK